jgi:formylglycine-generating enzyme required for sulfatase activity
MWNAAVAEIGWIFSAPQGLALSVRYEAAVAYGLTGDDRIADFDATWVALKGGQFWFGAQRDHPGGRNYDHRAAPWEGPVRRVRVERFEIRCYPITVQEYAKFVEVGYSGTRWWRDEGLQWRDRTGFRRPQAWEEQLLVPNSPVTGVSWFEADAYCRWLTDQRGDYEYRLPTEHEWVYAAAGESRSGAQFAWGDEIHWEDAAEANWLGSLLRRKSPVGLFPASTTSDGIADLFGNVEEWCVDEWSGTVGPGGRANPAAATAPESDSLPRVVLGGSCLRVSRLCRPTYRSRVVQGNRYPTLGFRPVRIARIDGGG